MHFCFNIYTLLVDKYVFYIFEYIFNHFLLTYVYVNMYIHIFESGKNFTLVLFGQWTAVTTSVFSLSYSLVVVGRVKKYAACLNADNTEGFATFNIKSL